MPCHDLDPRDRDHDAIGSRRNFHSLYGDRAIMIDELQSNEVIFIRYLRLRNDKIHQYLHPAYTPFSNGMIVSLMQVSMTVSPSGNDDIGNDVFKERMARLKKGTR